MGSEVNTLIPFSPRFSSNRANAQFRAAAIEIPPLVEVEDAVAQVDAFVTEWSAESVGIKPADSAAWAASIALLADLWLQGWQVQVAEQQVYLTRPVGSKGADERTRRRLQLLVRRSDQLATPSVHQFLMRMEQPGSGFGQATVLDLVVDGADLVASIEGFRGQCDPPIRPYVVAAQSGKRCEHTGLLLTDIWRYFRHTWTSPYESVPGRSLLLLVRDASRPRHPIIGIAALSSAAVKQRTRDKYIGWTRDGVAQLVRDRPKRRWKSWIERSLHSLWEEVYIEDLLSDGLVSTSTLTDSLLGDIEGLRDEAKRCRDEHQAHPERHASGNAESHEDAEWRNRALTPLFRSKRCEKVAMLAQLFALHRSLEESRSVKYASLLTDTADGQSLLEQIVRQLKARLVGTAIADLSVCGAVAPFSELAGGKLVALLSVSQAAQQLYRDRYAGQESVIASSMAGRAIIRDPELVFVGTSSLYGVRPNQYDSLAMPALAESGSLARLRYRYLGKSEGYGSVHIRRRTKRLLQAFMEADGRTGWRANNIFGEGANPNMRALREAIGELGLDANELLQHSQPRNMYGVRLCSNVTEYLIGLDKKPEYLRYTASAGEDAESVAEFWWGRWGKRRAFDEEIRMRMKQHSLAYPIAHGAVLNPPRPESNTPSMFADL